MGAGAFLLFNVVLLFGFSHAQNTEGGCTAYEVSQVPSTSALCSHYISKNVYLPQNTTLQSADASLHSDSTFQLLNKTMSIIPLTCYEKIMSAVCQSYFPTCAFSAFPSPPCVSVCNDNVLANCAPTWKILNVSAPLTCNLNPAGNPWPTQNCSTQIYPEDPVAPPSNETPARMKQCPSVYALRKHPKRFEGTCGLRCPDPSYTKKEWKLAGQGALVASVISLILQTFLICSYLIDPLKRAFPARVQMFLCIDVLGFTIGALMSGADPTTTTICADSTTYSTQDNNSLCAAQAFFLIYFGFGGVLWVFTLVFVIYVTVFHEIRPLRLKPFEKYLHLFAWGVSGIFIIAVCITKSLDFGYTTRTYCFLKVDDALKLSLDYPLFYIPVTIFCGGIFYMLAASVIKLIKYRALFKDATNDESKAGTVKAERRLLIVITICLVIFGTFFGSRFSTTKANAIAYNESGEAWVNCKVRAELFGYPYPTECELDYNPLRKPYSSVVFAGLVGCLGFWVFLFFGTDPRIFQQWSTLIQCLANGDTEGCWNRIKHGFDSSSNKSPNHSRTLQNSNSNSSSTILKPPSSQSQSQAIYEL